MIVWLYRIAILWMPAGMTQIESQRVIITVNLYGAVMPPTCHIIFTIEHTLVILPCPPGTHISFIWYSNADKIINLKINTLAI